MRVEEYSEEVFDKNAGVHPMYEREGFSIMVGITENAFYKTRSR